MTRSKESVYVLATGAELLWMIDHVAACARALEKARTAELKTCGLDRPTRRLLAELFGGGPRPVPQLAAALCVTRQAVQPIVDALLAAGEVELLPNPTRRRSPIVRLSETGFRRAANLQDMEAAIAERLAERFLAAHVTVTCRTLANLIFATTGARAWELPPLRAGYAAPKVRASETEAALIRHPVATSGLWV